MMMKGAKGCLLAGFLWCVGAMPAAELERYEFVEPHMGTLFRLVLYAPDATTAGSAAKAAFARIAGLNAALSDYDPHSELNRFCRAPAGRPFALDADLFAVLQRGQEIAAASGGAFDVTVGRLTHLWRMSRKSHRLPAPEILAAARQTVGWKNLVLHAESRTGTLAIPGIQLDLGGIAKGYAADAALAVLRARGCPASLVAASGDLALGDPPPGRSGWEVSLGSAAAAPRRLLSRCGVSTSGDSAQFALIDGVRYSHVLDPRTGLGLTERIEVTVIAPDATTSDGLDNALCILSPDEGRALLEKFPAASAHYHRPPDQIR